MKVGDLVKYTGTGAVYLVTWAYRRHFKLLGFGSKLFEVELSCCEVISEG